MSAHTQGRKRRTRAPTSTGLRKAGKGVGRGLGRAARSVGGAVKSVFSGPARIKRAIIATVVGAAVVAVTVVGVKVAIANKARKKAFRHG